MTIERLKQYKDLHKEAEKLQEQETRLRSKLESASAKRLSHAPGGTLPQEKLSEGVAELMELQKKQRDIFQQCDEIKLELEAAMQPLTMRERTIVRLRHIDLLRWEEICSRVYLSRMQVHRDYKTAIGKIICQNETCYKKLH